MYPHYLSPINYYPVQVLNLYRKEHALENHYARHTGSKAYELSDHLGNVSVTVSDMKWMGSELSIPQQGGGGPPPFPTDEEPRTCRAQVLSYTNYYAFGMAMPGRSKESASYRYGYNGQEKSPEIGENHTTALYWEYDGRIGRRWNVDPVVEESESPYATFRNCPILLNDPYGDRPPSKPGEYEGQTQEAYASWYSVFKTKYHWYTGGDDKSKAGWKEGEEYVDVLSKHIKVSLSEQNQIELSTDLAYDKIEEDVLQSASSKAINKALPPSQLHISMGENAGRFNPNFGGHTITSLFDPTIVLPWGRLFGFAGKTIKSVFGAVAANRGVQLALGTTRMRLLNNVSNPQLKKMIDFLYREGSTYGNGSTGSMIREELANGTVTSASGSHLVKAQGALNSMRGLLKGNHGALSAGDRKIVFEIIEDLTTGTGLKW